MPSGVATRPSPRSGVDVLDITCETVDMLVDACHRGREEQGQLGGGALVGLALDR